MKKRILFVGENQALCQEFQASCPGPESIWVGQHVATEEEALALCHQQTFAAVVAEVNLNGKSGNDLLDAFMRRQPKALRIIVSDLADVESSMKCIGHAHHHLLKPCNAQTLLYAFEQASAQEAWLPSEPVQGLIAQMRHVPSPLKAYTQIVQEMKSPTCSLERIAQLIAQDPAITAKVLQLANSAVFGLKLSVVHLKEAVGYIGLETTRAVVLLATPSLRSTTSSWSNSPSTNFGTIGGSRASVKKGGHDGGCRGMTRRKRPLWRGCCTTSASSFSRPTIRGFLARSCGWLANNNAICGKPRRRFCLAWAMLNWARP